MFLLLWCSGYLRELVQKGRRVLTAIFKKTLIFGSYTQEASTFDRYFQKRLRNQTLLLEGISGSIPVGGRCPTKKCVVYNIQCKLYIAANNEVITNNNEITEKYISVMTSIIVLFGFHVRQRQTNLSESFH